MSPIVHGMIAWLVAVLFAAKVNDRRLIVIAGVVPDIDGIFILFNSQLYAEYHHTFGHSFVFGMLVALVALSLSMDKIKVFLGALSAFAMHVGMDVIGSNWSIPVFYPVSDFSVGNSGTLSNNLVYNVINPFVFILSVIIILFVMYRKEMSPIEFLSEKLDRFLIEHIFPIKRRGKLQKTKFNEL